MKKVISQDTKMDLILSSHPQKTVDSGDKSGEQFFCGAFSQYHLRYPLHTVTFGTGHVTVTQWLTKVLLYVTSEPQYTVQYSARETIVISSCHGSNRGNFEESSM